VTLTNAELAAVANQFGVAEPQVQRDYAISHLLAVLSQHAADKVTFFGGTALARAYLPNGRLSEDVDLIPIGLRSSVAAVLDDVLATRARRRIGAASWRPALSSTGFGLPAGPMFVEAWALSAVESSSSTSSATRRSRKTFRPVKSEVPTITHEGLSGSGGLRGAR